MKFTGLTVFLLISLLGCGQVATTADPNATVTEPTIPSDPDPIQQDDEDEQTDTIIDESQPIPENEEEPTDTVKDPTQPSDIATSEIDPIPEEDEEPTETLTEEPEPTPEEAEPTPEAEEPTEEPVAEPDPTPPTVEPTPSQGILFGFWGLNGFINDEDLPDIASRFNTTVFQVASSAPHYTITDLLPLVRDSGMKITLRMTGNHSDYTTSGNFDLAKWKAQIDVWTASADYANLQQFIDDGTLAGHMLLDDIFTFTGTDPTAAELDEMARYSEVAFPGLMTFVRNKASTMPVPTTTTGQYVYLDSCVNQYTNYSGFSDGPIATYAQTQHDTALALGLGIINGLNIADGGDGSSGVVGASSGKYAMSATEITTYGTALLSVPDVTMFLMWEYDGEQLWNAVGLRTDGIRTGNNYFDTSEVQNALFELGVLAAQYSTN